MTDPTKHMIDVGNGRFTRYAPIHNSLGERIHHTDEGIRNFHRWFDDSVITQSHHDPALRDVMVPSVYYHERPMVGISNVLTNGFDLSRVARSGGETHFPFGVFLKPTSQQIFNYRGDDTPVQIPVYVRSRKPLAVYDRDHFENWLMKSPEYANAHHELKRLDSHYNGEFDRTLKTVARGETWKLKQITDEWGAKSDELHKILRQHSTDLIKNAGFDSVMMPKDSATGVTGNKSKHTSTLLVLDPRDIKAAHGNSGKFQDGNPSLIS